MTRHPGLRFVIFAVFSGGLALFVAFQILGVSFGPQYGLTASLSDAGGMQVGDQVRVAGVPVGAVEAIGVADGQAQLTLAVDREVRLPTDSLLVVSWLDLTGRRQVDLHPGEADTMLTDGDRIDRTRSAPDLSRLASRLGSLGRTLDPDEVNQLLASVDEVLTGRVDDVTGLSADVAALLETVADRDDTIDDMLGDYARVADTMARREQQIRALVDNLVLVTEEFEDPAATLGPALGDAADLTDRLSAFLDANADETGVLLEDIASVLATTTGRIDDLEQGLRDLPDAMQELYGVVRHGDYLRVDAVCASVSEPPCPALRSGSTASRARPVDDADSLRHLLLGGGG